MQQGTFEINTSDSETLWAEILDGQVTIHRTLHDNPDQDAVIARWGVEVLQNLLAWATKDGPVTSYFAGPMAHQIRKHSEELGMTPEMFVWHAVKLFIDTGTSP